MVAAIEITSELVPYIILAVAAIFTFGYFIGHRLGKIDGETETARWYEDRRKRNNNCRAIAEEGAKNETME